MYPKRVLKGVLTGSFNMISPQMSDNPLQKGMLHLKNMEKTIILPSYHHKTHITPSPRNNVEFDIFYDHQHDNLAPLFS